MYAGVFCTRRKMSRRIEKKIRRILSLVENVQENRKNNWEEIVLGGKYPGGLKIYLGGICD